MSEPIKKFTLALGDFSLLWLALVGAFVARSQEFTSTAGILREHAGIFALLFTVWLIVFTIVNLYDLRELLNNLEFFIRLGKALFVNALISTAFFYFVPGLAIAPKTILVLLVGISFVLVFGWRRVFNSIVSASFLQKRAVVIGWDPATLELARELEARPQLGYRLQGIVRLAHHRNPALEEPLKTKELAVALPELAGWANREHIEALVISPEAWTAAGVSEALQECLNHGLECLTVSTLFETKLKRVALTFINHVWLLDAVGGERRRAYAFVKRLLDIGVAVALGLIFLVPGLFTALAIKWDSRGPVFYRQTRVGKGGREFWLFKCRSMIANDPFGGAEGLTGARLAGERDPRITRVGRLIRRFHLDELPQLWNIVKGEMSLVGPRPERPEFYEKWRALIPFFETRLIVKPGFTGWAQLHYTYADTPEASAKNLQHDLYYIKHRSLLLDLGILVKTVRIFLKGGGR